MLVKLKKNATMLQIIDAINLLSAAEPGMNSFISKTFENKQAQINILKKQNEQLTQDINDIAQFLNNKIDLLKKMYGL